MCAIAIYQSRLKTHSGNAREKKYGQVELNLSPAIYSQMQVDRLCAVKNVLFKAASKTIDNAFHRVVYILQPKINNNLGRWLKDCHRYRIFLDLDLLPHTIS